jgi:hypothetical protein
MPNSTIKSRIVLRTIAFLLTLTTHVVRKIRKSIQSFFLPIDLSADIAVYLLLGLGLLQTQISIHDFARRSPQQIVPAPQTSAGLSSSSLFASSSL